MQSTVFDSQSSACLIQSHCLALTWQANDHSESTVVSMDKCCFYKKLLASDVSEFHWFIYQRHFNWYLVLAGCLFQTLWEWEQTVSACLPGPQGVPGRINISIKVLLRGLASANAIAWVIIGKDVAVDACA